MLRVSVFRNTYSVLYVAKFSGSLSGTRRVFYIAFGNPAINNNIHLSALCNFYSN